MGCAPHLDAPPLKVLKGGFCPKFWYFIQTETARQIHTKLTTRHRDHALTLSCSPHSHISPGKGAMASLPESLIHQNIFSSQTT